MESEGRFWGQVGVPRKMAKGGIVAKPRKLKTHRGAAKRFHVTKSGKIMRHHSGKRHLLGTKAPKRMRKLGKAIEVSPADAANLRLMLPYA
jgi:large subunit ribosomal protein L35